MYTLLALSRLAESGAASAASRPIVNRVTLPGWQQGEDGLRKNTRERETMRERVKAKPRGGMAKQMRLMEQGRVLLALTNRCLCRPDVREVGVRLVPINEPRRTKSDTKLTTLIS